MAQYTLNTHTRTHTHSYTVIIPHKCLHGGVLGATEEDIGLPRVETELVDCPGMLILKYMN